MSATAQFHPLPVIGYPEAWYARHLELAHESGDQHAHASYKVGQYVTLGLRQEKPWEEKLKCFRHALKHYCSPPAGADPILEEFYHKLCDLVRRQAGHEAVRLARIQGDGWAMRLELGVDRSTVEDEADLFFSTLCGHCDTCPEWCSKEAWIQLRAIRDRWI